MDHGQLEDIGPIDYIVIEWPTGGPTGEAVPMILDLVDRGIIRVLDIALLAKGEDGSVASLEIGEIDELAEFEGASTGLIGQDDLDEAAALLEPGTFAAILIWENRWAAPIAAAIRRSGGQLASSGRIPVQAILASLDAAEAATS